MISGSYLIYTLIIKNLIDKKIIELQEFQKEGNKNDILEEVMSYYRLKKVLSAKLNRVV